MVDIAFPVLAFFASLAIVMFVFSIIAKRLIDAYIPVLSLLAGVIWITLFVTYDKIDVLGSPVNSTNTITPTQVDYMDVNIGTSVTKLSGGGVNNIFAGEEIVNTDSMLYNKRIDQACMSLTKTGSPTGTVNIAVYDSVVTPTQANYLYLLGTKDSTTLTTTQTSYCFIGVDTYITTTNQAIGAFFNGGSAGNEVNVFSNATGNVFDGTNSIRTRYVASWSDFTTTDTRMSVSLNGIQEQTLNEYSKQDIGFETNEGARLKLFFLIIGISFMLTGIAERYAGRNT